MHRDLIQKSLDAADGPVIRNNRYCADMKSKTAIAKWKTHGRNGNNYSTKIPRSNA